MRYRTINEISRIDNNIYIVRDELNKQQAANILAIIKHKSILLIEKLFIEYPNDNKILLLIKKFNPNNIYETSYKKKYTSYSYNKGEQIYLCLRNSVQEFVDINIIFYVMMHELTHIMTDSWGHNNIFWDNFKFIINHAIKYKLYIFIDYQQYPQPYCGIKINSNP